MFTGFFIAFYWVFNQEAKGGRTPVTVGEPFASFFLSVSLSLSLSTQRVSSNIKRSIAIERLSGGIQNFNPTPPPTRVHAKRANQKIAFEVDSLQRTTTAAAPLVCRRLIGRLTQSLFGARRFPSVGNRWCGGSCLMLTLTANRLVFVDISLIKRFRRLPSSNDDDEAENEPRFCISSPWFGSILFASDPVSPMIRNGLPFQARFQWTWGKSSVFNGYVIVTSLLQPARDH